MTGQRALQTRRYQIEWMLLGTVLLILGALTGYWLYTERDRVEARERDRLQTQARVIDENLGRQLEGVNNALASVRNDFPPSDSENIGPTISRRLKVLSDAMPGVRTMLIFDAKGTVLASSRDELIGMNFRHREYFKVPRERPDPATLYVSPPFKTVLGVYSINVVRVVTGVKGEFAGIVSATLDPEYFSVLLSSVLYAPDMWTSIAHGDGQVFLFVPPHDKALGMNLDRPGSFPNRHLETGPIATVMTGNVYATGEERMMAQRIVNPAGLHMDKHLGIAVSRDLAALYAAWRRDVFLNSGFYGAFALTAILSLYFFQRRRRTFDRLTAAQENEQREGAERLELALRGGELGLWDCHLPSGKLICNERWSTMLGYALDEIGRDVGSWQKLVHPDDWPAIHAALDPHLKGETPAYESEHRLRHKDGHWVWILDRGKVMERDAAGAPVRMVGTHLDVTERKQMELALRASEEKYRGIYDSLQDLYVETDLDGTVLDIGPSVEELTGGQYKREDLLGRSAQDFYGDPERRTAFLRTLALSGSVKDFESTFVNRDGSVVPCSISAMLRLDAEGGPRRIVSMMRDITARKRAEASLRESEERLRAIFEGSLDGILVADAESKKFLTGNPTICRMLGYTLDEIVRIGVSDIHPKQDLPRVMAEFERRRCGEIHISADIPVMRKDGSVFYADIQSALIRLSGRNCLLGHFRDVTERKQAEETQAKLAAIVESSNDAIIGRALDGTVTSWNAAAERILGYAAAETIGRDPVEIFPPRLQQQIAEYRKLVRAGQMVPNHETVHIAKDGRHIDLAVSLTAIKDDSGRIIGTATTLRDITERKRAEYSLRESEERFRIAFEHAPVGVCLVNTEGYFFRANGAFCRMLGYSESELLAKTFLEVTHPNDVTPSDEWVRRLLAGKATSLDLEKRYLHAAGHIVWGRVRASLMRKPDGSPLFFITHVQDITARKQAEETLRESEQNFRTLVDRDPYGVQRIDIFGTIIFANKAHHEMYGYEEGALMGRSIADFLVPGSQRDELPGYLEMLVKDQPLPTLYQQKILTKNGEERDIDVMWNYLRDAEGNVEGFLSTLTDITERKQAEAALRESVERYRSLVEQSPDMIGVLVGGRLAYLNPAGVRLFGADRPEQMLHKSIADYLHPDDLPVVSERIRQATALALPNPLIELRIFRLDGTMVHIDSVSTPLDYQGQPAVQFICRDITERKRAVEALQISETRYRSLFDNMVEGFAYCRMLFEDGRPQDFIYVDVNEAFQTQTGLKNVIGRKVSELIPGIHESNPELFERYGRVALTGQPERFETYIATLKMWFSISVYSPHKEYFVAVFEVITERKQAEKRMQMLSQEILAAREEERKQVSSVLHHDVGSMAVGISAHLDAIEEDLRSGKPGEALKWTKRIRKLFDESVIRIKEVAMQLRPPELDILGLRAALRQHFSQVTKHAGIQIQFRETLGRRRVSGGIATTLFRIAQEALTNAIAHGHAKRVEVRLWATKKEIRLTVRDNGKGFDPSKREPQETSKMGLPVMREMAASAGGAFAIDSGRRKGTTVHVSLPLKTAALVPGDVTLREETMARGKTPRSAGRGSRAHKGSGA